MLVNFSIDAIVFILLNNSQILTFTLDYVHRYFLRGKNIYIDSIIEKKHGIFLCFFCLLFKSESRIEAALLFKQSFCRHVV